jgi:site-specific DNA-methyltransferase (adenine-specific)
VSPYYQDSAVTIYCGDCRELLPSMPFVDLVLTDPPYGIGASGKKFINGTSATKKDYYEDVCWDTAPPPKSVFDALLCAGKSLIIWGGNYFPLPPTRCFLIWDKTIHGNSYADCEMAWTSFDKVARIKALNMVATNLDGRVHPTQKPLDLMTWCIAQAPSSQTILDPFMGSGTTLRAAKDLGRKAIGIEIEERYCEIAAKRMQQEVLAL